MRDNVNDTSPSISSLLERGSTRKYYCMTREDLMNDPLAATKVKAEKAYNAAAESFDAEPLAF